MDNTADDREEELSSLTAIFPEIEISDSDRFSFSLDIPVTPAEPPQVRFSSSKHVITLSHLPHLRLDMTLPVDYPTKQAPIIKLSSNPAWVPGAKLGELRDQATDLWEQYGRSQMAFDFIDSLQQAAERVFDLAAGSDNVLDLDGSMQQVIIKFNKEAAKKVFDAETFDCGVCLDPKKGLDCHKLHKCGHVFCLECLRSAYDAAIVEGDVSSVKCLFPDCGVERDTTTKRATKAAPTLGPDELLDVPIALAAVERYVKLKRKKRFESFPKTVYCPRKWCQGIARHKRFPKKAIESMTAEDLEPEVILAEADAEPKDLRNNQDRLRICEDCDLAFCRVCLATWHGEYVTRCWPRTADELTEEEKASYSYLLKYTSPCPSCDFAIQKSMGCNHITCFNCRQHFCYLCSSWLDPSNPYEHFNKKGTPCFQRLWDMEGGDDADGNVQFMGIRGAELAAAIAEEEEQQAQPHEQAIDNQAHLAVEEAQQAIQGLNINDDAIPVQDAAPPVAQVPLANPFDDDDSDGEWEAAPARWRNQWFEPAQPGRPRQPRLPALGGGGFHAHRDRVGLGNGYGVGDNQRHVRNRRAMVREAMAEIGNAQRPRQVILAQAVAEQRPRDQADADRIAAGLQRFLQMAAEDREDEWDSDELDDDDDLWAIPDAPPRVQEPGAAQPQMPFLQRGN